MEDVLVLIKFRALRNNWLSIVAQSLSHVTTFQAGLDILEARLENMEADTACDVHFLQ